MRSIHQLVACLAMACLAFSANAQYIDGQDYMRIDAGTSRDTPTIEVVEFFAYACPYCARVEMPLQVWQDEMMPENVTFTRVAIPRKGRWNTYAKAYYALQSIDPEMEKKLAPEIMKAVVYQKQDLDNDAAFIDWAVKHGVDRKKLTELMASKEIAQKVEDALKLSEQYGVPSVPALYVDGRYYIVHNDTYYEKIPLMLNALIAQAWEERKQPTSTVENTSQQPQALQNTELDGGACRMDAGTNACE